MKESNEEPKIDGTFTYKMPFGQYTRLFKPMVIEITIDLNPENMKNLMFLTNSIEMMKSKSLAVVPLWSKYAENLGINLQTRISGSFFDPVRLLVRVVLYTCTKVLNKYGIEKYREAFNIQ